LRSLRPDRVVRASRPPWLERPAPRARAEPVLSAATECPGDSGRDARATTGGGKRDGTYVPLCKTSR
jgi:hypothetical protein